MSGAAGTAASRAPAAALLEAALELRPDGARLAALRRAAEDPALDLAALLEVLEGHGVLNLVLGNLRAAGIALPTGAGQAARRASAASGRAGVTTERALSALAGAGVSCILLKGAALVRDVYPDPNQRQQGDVDLLVRPGALRRARTALRGLGLGLSERQLPAWWYRATHFHLKLKDPAGLLCDVELHWRLQSPALLLMVEHEDLWRRARPVPGEQGEVLSLDPLDRYLHLATHLLSHWQVLPAQRGTALFEVLLDARQTGSEPKIKWIVDLAAEAGRLAREEGGAGALLARCQAWQAGPALAAAADLVLRSGLADADGAACLEDILRGLPSPAGRARGARPAHAAPHPALDLRLEALRRWPRWFCPPLAWVQRRYGLPSGAAGRILALPFLAAHTVVVALRTQAAVLLLGPALIWRWLARGARRRAAAAARASDRVLDLVVALRRAGVALPGKDAAERER